MMEQQNSTAAMLAIAGARYINLESYKRDGGAVRTPVWFAAAPGAAPVFYFYTTGDSFKTKRIRRNGVVKIAACDMRGNVQGAWIAAQANIVSGADFQTGMQLLDRKYFPWKQLLGIGAFFRKRERVVMEIRSA